MRGGPQLRRDDGVGQVARRAEDEISLRLSDRGARLVRILLRRQPRQPLHVVDADHRVGRNRRAAGRHHVVEAIDADERRRRGDRTGHTTGRDLRVGEVADEVVGEAAARQAAQQRDARHERR